VRTGVIDQHVVTFTTRLVVDTLTGADLITPNANIVFVLQFVTPTGNSASWIGAEPVVTALRIFLNLLA
jgi:hypothetical protein